MRTTPVANQAGIDRGAALASELVVLRALAHRLAFDGQALVRTAAVVKGASVNGRANLRVGAPQLVAAGTQAQHLLVFVLKNALVRTSPVVQEARIRHSASGFVHEFVFVRTIAFDAAVSAQANVRAAPVVLQTRVPSRARSGVH